MDKSRSQSNLLEQFLKIRDLVEKFILEREKKNRDLRTEDLKTDISHFFLQLLCLNCILQKIRKVEKNFLEPKTKSKDSPDVNQDFSYFFELDREKKHYRVDFKKIITIFFNIFSINESSLPKIFSENKNWLIMNMSEIFWNKTITEKLQTLFTADITPEDVSNFFEGLNQSQRKGKTQQGVYYTPQADIKCTILFACFYYLKEKFKAEKGKESNNINNSDLIRVLDTLLKDSPTFKEFSAEDKIVLEKIYLNLNQAAILDPSCGSGSFLSEFYCLFLNITEFAINCRNGMEIVPHFQIFGIDINPWAIHIAEFRIFLQNLNLLIRQKITDKSKKFLCHHFIHNNNRILHFIQADFIKDNIKIQNSAPNFDIIVGNPPFIRNRDICDPMNPTQKENQQYREKIKAVLAQVMGKSFDSQRLDYYLYFFYLSLNQLAINGILGFITSNSWMNVEYGYEFQGHICKNYQIRAFIESVHKSFDKADINTIISIIQRPQDGPEWNEPIKCCQFKESFSLTHSKHNKNWAGIVQNIVLELRNGLEIQIRNDKSIRILECSQKFVYNFNIKEDLADKEMYRGYNWRNYYFLAPDFFFELRKTMGQMLLNLGEIADIKRGLTTNCNDYFVLKRIDEKLYQNGLGLTIPLEADVITEFITSPRQIEYPLLDLNAIDTVGFYTSDNMEILEEKGLKNAIKYVNYGESVSIKIKKGAAKGEELKGITSLASFQGKYSESKNTWYCLKPKQNRLINGNKIILQKIYDDTYKIAFIDHPILVNNTFYEITMKPEFKGQEKMIMSLLLSTLTVLSLELHGRTNFGGGALDTSTNDIGNIMILNPKKLSEGDQQQIRQKAEILFTQRFESFESSIKKKEKREYDKFILDLLGLNVTIDNVYEEISVMINQRKRKKKEL